MAALSMQGVSKVFAGPVPAVQDLDLEIRDQELVVLVGPSGSGKTTTLRLIAGLEDPDHGVIRFDGRVVNRTAPRDRNVAMVFQHGVLYPHLTVYQNMAAGLEWRYGGGWIRRGWNRWRHPAEAQRSTDRRQAIARQVQDAAEILGVDHLLDRMPRQLSGGECQRVALGRAIVRRPAAFLLDEPLSHLDAQLRVAMRQELKRLHQRVRTTMVYVTHDQAEALALGDRIVVMHEGRIQQTGSPREVYERPANVMVAGFLGSPRMNLIPGRWQWEAGAGRFVSDGLAIGVSTATAAPQALPDGASVTCGIRPEHLRLLGVQTASPDAERRTGTETTLVIGAGRIVMTELLGPSVLASVVMAATRDAVRRQECRGREGERQRLELEVLVPAGQPAEEGREVAIGLDPSRAHFFDGRTGENMNGTRPGNERPAGRSRAGCEPQTEN
jgi:multiple sugar transport system ATP-binding protein